MWCRNCWYNSNPCDSKFDKETTKCTCCGKDISEFIKEFDEKQNKLKELINSPEYVKKWGPPKGY
jgi:hypothetical protein